MSRVLCSLKSWLGRHQKDRNSMVVNMMLRWMSCRFPLPLLSRDAIALACVFFFYIVVIPSYYFIRNASVCCAHAWNYILISVSCVDGTRLGADGQDFFTSYDEVCESFDAMGLQENLLRGIYAYGMYINI